MARVERIESGLRLSQRRLQLAGLKHLMRMIRRHAQGLSSVHDILAQSESQRSDALLRLLVPDGIIVERPQYAGEIGIVASVVLLAHHLLQYHSHLLLVDDVARSGHIRLRVAIIHRRIHTLDGTSQHLQHGILVLQIRNHIRGIYSGERLIMSVFEERRRSDCHRTLRGFEEREEVGDERVGQLRTQEVAQYLFVGGVAERYLVQIVLLHELVEDVRTQHHGLRYLNRHTGERTEVGVHLYDIVKESQTSTLSSERTVADAGEVRVRVELHTVEHSHHTDVLHVAILHDGVEDNLTVSGDVLQTFPRDFLQEVRHGEDGTRREPAAHVVARDMIEHRVVRNAEYVVLQFLQVMYAHNLRLRLRVAEYEVAEAHVLLHY